MKKYLFIPGLLLIYFGCANPYAIDPLQEQSAKQGHVPCEADMIEVIEHKTNPDGSEDWMALCSGDTYSCEKAAGQEGQINCSKMESQMPE